MVNMRKDFNIVTLEQLIEYCKNEIKDWDELRWTHEKARREYKELGMKTEAEDERSARDTANENYKMWLAQEDMLKALYAVITGRKEYA